MNALWNSATQRQQYRKLRNLIVHTDKRSLVPVASQQISRPFVSVAGSVEFSLPKEQLEGTNGIELRSPAHMSQKNQAEGETHAYFGSTSPNKTRCDSTIFVFLTQAVTRTELFMSQQAVGLQNVHMCCVYSSSPHNVPVHEWNEARVTSKQLSVQCSMFMFNVSFFQRQTVQIMSVLT